MVKGTMWKFSDTLDESFGFRSGQCKGMDMLL